MTGRDESSKGSKTLRSTRNRNVSKMEDITASVDPSPLIDIPNYDNHDVSVQIETSEEKKGVKKRGRPKGSKNGSGAKKPKPVKAKANNSPRPDKPKIIRVSKHLTSVKDKLVRIYGENKDKLLDLAVQKERFETAVFDFKESQVIDSRIPFQDITDSFELGDPTVVEISPAELDAIVPLNNEEVKFDIGNDQFGTLKNEATHLPVFNYGTRQGVVFNTGGFISDMAWSSIPDSVVQYLAVSVCSDKNAASYNLRLFGSPVPHPAVLNIYKFDTASNQVSLFYQLAHDDGVVWDLKWHPGFSCNDQHIGVLTGVFQDGYVKFLPIKRSYEGCIHHLQIPALGFTGPESHITSFSFINSYDIVCGFQNGYYGEYSTDTRQFYRYKQIFESYVISTVALRSKFEPTLISMSSIDGNCCVFDPRDVRLSKAFCTRTRGSNTLPIVYSPQLYTVLRTDSLSSIKAFTPRAVFVDHNICQHDNTVVCLGTSPLHPMLLSGGADGSIMLNNLVRRMLQGLKNNTDIYRYIRLWKWDYDESKDRLRLNPQYQVYKFSNTETSNVKIDYPSINIESVKWIEEPKLAKWFSFANSAGFIVVEKL